MAMSASCKYNKQRKNRYKKREKKKYIIYWWIGLTVGTRMTEWHLYMNLYIIQYTTVYKHTSSIYTTETEAMRMQLTWKMRPIKLNPRLQCLRLLFL